MREPWKAEQHGDSILQADENIPPERVQEVLSVTQKVQKGLDASLEGNPIGKPEAAIIILRWGEGESAVIAEPANDPALILGAMWSALTAGLQALGMPVDEFLKAVDARADEVEMDAMDAATEPAGAAEDPQGARADRGRPGEARGRGG